MGLTPIELSDWCKQAITAEQRDEKLTLLRTNFLDVVQATRTSLPAQRLLADYLGETHRDLSSNLGVDAVKNFGIKNSDGTRPLINAALCVPEDLCLLERRNTHYELVAGCVTAPSYWRLRDKLGKTLPAVHDNVPGLNAQLGERMAAFFERLPSERCLLRRNWFLHGSSQRYQPEPEHRTPITLATAAAALTVRSETQTLRRLSDDVIAFTINVSCYPLKEVVDYPLAARAMHNALTSRNNLEREAANQQAYEIGVLAFLEQSADSV